MRSPLLKLTLVLLALAGTAGATPRPAERTLWYRSIGVAEGLSQGFVSAMAQDDDGYLWFGTLDGLNRYDGRRFEVFRHDPDDPTSLGAGAIYSLHIDRAGRLWVGTESGLDRFDSATRSFAHFHNDPSDAGSPSAGHVEFMDSDQAGNLWFVTSSLHRLDAVSGEVARIPIEPRGGLHVTWLEADRQNRLWLASSALDPLGGDELGTYRLEAYEIGDGSSADLAPLSQAVSELASDQGPVQAMVEDPWGGIWYGREQGDLVRFEPQGRSKSIIRLRGGTSPTPPPETIRSLALDKEGGLWVLAAEEDRLFYVDLESRRAEPVALRSELGPREGRALMKHLFVDRTGVLWIATDAGGLRSVDVSSRGFDLHRLDGEEPGSSFVRAILEDSQGTVWVGTPSGVQRLGDQRDNVAADPARDLHGAALEAQNVQAIHEDRRGRIWVGTDHDLVRWDSVTGETTRLPSDAEDPEGLGGKSIQVIHEDRRGTIWIGTGYRGLYALRADGAPILHFRHNVEDPGSLPSDRIQAIVSDEADRLWVGTSAGLAVAEGGPPEAMHFRRFPLADSDRRTGSLSAIHLSPQDPGVLWLGWRGFGLSRLEVETGLARHWTSRDSELPNDTVYAILQDTEGRLWMSTNRGLASFDPAGEAFRSYGLDRGLQSLEFNARAAFRAPDGQLFFGGVDGLNAFYPERLKDNPYPPQVRVHRVAVLDRDQVAPTVPFVPRLHAGMRGESLDLGPRERDLQFEFAALHYTNPNHNRFSYRLDPFDSGWREPVQEAKATYTNLEPGRYTFRVRALSSHGIWSEGTDEVAFTIRPPFYATAWFLGLGLLVLGAALAGGFAWRTRSLRSRQAFLEGEVAERTAELRKTLALVQKQARDLAKLDEAKSRFFANVSHEFRTPLMLTLGPLEELQQGRFGTLSEEALANVDLALRNTRQQLALVDQLLTLAALESGSIHLERRHARLDEMLRSVASRFLGHARSRGLELQLELPVEAVWFDFDEEKLESIVSNLLSNACKYSSAGGRVALRLRSSPEAVTLEVEDDGIGIPEESQDRVFERFYRDGSEHSGHPGTGIGLALVCELVELHEGRVRLESQPGSGSTFVVELPRPKSERETGDESNFEAATEEVDTDASSERPTILLAEDHSEMRAFIRRQLEDRFEVVEAEEGRSALALARKRVPDLVLSDVMMDGMDGFELCAELRGDPELAHLPIILLTARADHESRLEGLGRGADDYLVKPFERRELLLRVGNLLSSRHRLRERILQEARRLPHPPDNPAGASASDVFIRRLNGILETRALEEAFSIADLASDLAMSRAKLFRRVGEVCETTPGELILQFRLERAAQLLRQSAGDVGEVAYSVGFKSVSHFIRRFRERFGTTPASYAGDPPERRPTSQGGG